jgi:hypothetical protein
LASQCPSPAVDTMLSASPSKCLTSRSNAIKWPQRRHRRQRQNCLKNYAKMRKKSGNMGIDRNNETRSYLSYSLPYEPENTALAKIMPASCCAARSSRKHQIHPPLTSVSAHTLRETTQGCLRAAEAPRRTAWMPVGHRSALRPIPPTAVNILVPAVPSGRSPLPAPLAARRHLCRRRTQPHHASKPTAPLLLSPRDSPCRLEKRRHAQ